ncbi:PIN-like domain-containing protein [Sinorhizobium garamanticum]|uniref:PIN-like domain-containing protein n=1 Tax=Sinorhizobium garamanticum TaxID=680247 RepID=A0ABY8DEN0_9HYPH|nr:PIN-like domain-containing protein [Sinorhizobium garamanticum]WEX88157.1 PIN-like domain-containing protein [Sinorhizobium garamanticum]
MKSTFSEFYKPTDNELKTLWKEGLFVIDANVVLHFYRYPVTARDDLLKALSKVGDRLWMPFQAALEYQRKRLDIIAEQKKAFETISNDLDSAVGKIEALFNSRHPLIEPGPLVTSIRELVTSYTEALQPLSDRQPAVHESDTIRDQIDALLAGRVGEEPSKESVEKICVEGIERYERKIPPGFMDIKKEDAFYFRGTKYETKYGDLLLWRQIIEKAKEHSCKSLILITDDTKEDWWQTISGKTIGPLPALKAEIKSAAGVENFHMYTTENFLRFSDKYLHADIDPKSIEQVAEINEAVNDKLSLSHYLGRRNGRSLRVYFDRNLSRDGMLEAAGKITDVAQRYFPNSDLEFKLLNGTFRFTAPHETHDFDLYSQISKIPGVLDVRSVPANLEHETESYLHRQRPQLENPVDLYDLRITFDLAEGLPFSHLANWIKMTLVKELSEGKDAIRTFTATSVLEGLVVNIHIPITLRRAHYLTRTIKDMDGVADVVVTKASH